MRGLLELFSKWRAVFGKRELDADLQDEVEFHLQMETDAGLRRGLSVEEARRQARLKCGYESAAVEEIRDQRLLGWLDGTLGDLRQAVVALRRHRGFTSIALAALALAVALNTLIFTMLDGVLLRPLPYPHPERLVRIFEATPRNPKWPVSMGNFADIRHLNKTLDSAGLYTEDDLQLMHGEVPERLTSMSVSHDFFTTVGILPALGRNFEPADSQAAKARVVILSNLLWRTRFQSDASIVGRTIRLNRESWTVVGVLPPGFQHVGGSYRSPLQGDTVDLWYPLKVNPESRGSHFTNLIARMKPGVTLEQMRQDAQAMSAELARRHPGPDKDLALRVEPLSTELVGKSSDTVWLLAAAGGLVLLIACANVAGLCIARSLARRREIAVCRALGAGSWRIIRSVLCENLVLGAAGGALGLALAAALTPAWRALLPLDFPRVHDVQFTGLAALFALGCALFTSLLAGLAPAWRQSHVDPAASLTQESRGASSGREANRLRALLVAGEVAFATVLCVSAALLVQSSLRLGARDHGFDPNGVLTFQLALPRNGYETPEKAARFYEDLVGRWRALPGVGAAALATNIPWTGYDENSSFSIEGIEPRPGDSTQGRYQMTSPGYFEALRIPLRAGRTFDQRDGAAAPKVVIVNEALVRRYMPGIDPIGRVLKIFGSPRQLVGVVADNRDRPSDLNAEPGFWLPLSQMPMGQLHAVLRTSGDPLHLLTGATAALHEVDRELPIAEPRAMTDVTRAALAERNLANWLLQSFAALALLLAVFGIYGLLAYVVEQRHREFGIRVAMGATRRDILWLVLKGGLAQALAGAALGALLAPVAARSMSSLLYGVTFGDPASLVWALAFVLCAALLASFTPALGAARADPSIALRDE
ncbi:ABC transporter permease [uncultured Paludibaculum sp.]|uniref:ABC transporter permease n=1 Tax=uncultured Paludibaculum sp. TaxID=1765020 RepID=UPI002AAB69CB|nr:ABC transporter permease [uncultured Paludibaculum sp.]